MYRSSCSLFFNYTAPPGIYTYGHTPFPTRRSSDLLVNRVWRMLELAEYKRRQACPGVKITRRAFGRDRRYPITNAFRGPARSEEHTSELQSLMRTSYAVFCLKKKNKKTAVSKETKVYIHYTNVYHNVVDHKI